MLYESRMIPSHLSEMRARDFIDKEAGEETV